MSPLSFHYHHDHLLLLHHLTAIAMSQPRSPPSPIRSPLSPAVSSHHHHHHEHLILIHHLHYKIFTCKIFNVKIFFKLNIKKCLTCKIVSCILLFMNNVMCVTIHE
jgi:hypothetical protein